MVLLNSTCSQPTTRRVFRRIQEELHLLRPSKIVEVSSNLVNLVHIVQSISLHQNVQNTSYQEDVESE